MMFASLDVITPSGMNRGMKVAVSIPDDVFLEADRLAERRCESRSALYAKALACYLQAHDEDWITASLDAVVEAAGEAPDTFVREAARRGFQASDW